MFANLWLFSFLFGIIYLDYNGHMSCVCVCVYGTVRNVVACSIWLGKWLLVATQGNDGNIKGRQTSSRACMRVGVGAKERAICPKTATVCRWPILKPMQLQAQLRTVGQRKLLLIKYRGDKTEQFALE